MMSIIADNFGCIIASHSKVINDWEKHPGY